MSAAYLYYFGGFLFSSFPLDLAPGSSFHHISTSKLLHHSLLVFHLGSFDFIDIDRTTNSSIPSNPHMYHLKYYLCNHIIAN
jgi:hypothetical protein